MVVKRFRKKPVEIESVQFKTNDDLEFLVEWIRSNNREANHNGSNLFIKTLEGVMQADYGDWIVKGIKGEFYPCKPDIFHLTYEEV